MENGIGKGERNAEGSDAGAYNGKLITVCGSIDDRQFASAIL